MSEEHPQPSGISVHTGFPNPATDTSLRSLDLNKLLIRHSASTYLFRVRGTSWESQGIFDTDIAIIDRSLSPRPTDKVIWWDEHQDQFAISTCKAMPAEASLWGVITTVIHQYRSHA